MNLLIADDESIVRQGLRCIIDWQELGFTICGEAATGEEALEKILTLQPDLVMMDIKMPKMTGIEVVEAARAQHYTGKFIILSGVSDFKYAQTAMRCGVDFYLTKPIDEDELQNAVVTVRQSIEAAQKHDHALRQYRSKAKDSILQGLLLGTASPASLDVQDLNLTADIYQVILYENYNQELYTASWNFAESLTMRGGSGKQPYEIIQINSKNYVLLKGSGAIQHLAMLLHHYAPHKGSPFDSLFLACGRQVTHLEDISLSANDVTLLEQRRFFCEPDQHILTIEALPAADTLKPVVSDQEVAHWQQLFSNYIQTHNREKLVQTLKLLQETLYCASDNLNRIQYFLTDIYLQVKQNIAQVFSSVDIPFPSNAAVLNLIENKQYLYEIIQFFSEQFEIWFNAIGTPASDNILNDLLVYIQNNFRENLRLETLAPLFGYNSSYLGKLFSKKVGCSFNAYVDKIRIDYAMEALKNSNKKVYEIADQTGYCNVDYFHKKFRKYVGVSPAEYRRQNQPNSTADTDE